MQKVSVDAGFTCPHRDADRKGGCVYCNNSAFSPSYCDPEKSITRQIEEGIKFIAWRYRRATRYIAYFQSYSNTYAPVDKLEQMYAEALSHEGVSGIAIGTRPDCVSDEHFQLLKNLSGKCFVQLEFGVESVFDETLRLIERGHTFQCSADAIRKSAEYGLYTGAHLILGLPGEERDEAEKTASVISSLPLHSIKIHQLQVIRDTKLALQYETHPGSVKLLSMEEYIPLCIRFLEMLNPAICLERLTAEVPPRYLLAPDWGRIRSDEVLRVIEKEMEALDTWQGKKFADQ